MKTLRIKAILTGLATDIGGSIVVGIVLGFLIAAIAVASGDTTPQHFAVPKANVILKAVGLLGTTFFTSLGGYVAARMAEPYCISNALALGLLSLLLGLSLAAAAPGAAPMWKLLLGALLTVPAALAGGRLAAQNHV